MICPKCGKIFSIAYLYRDKDKQHTEKLECPHCHELWENPSLNRCVLRNEEGKCIRTHETCDIGYEKCVNYISDKSQPPLGCSPYYVSISARICELCEAIKRYSTQPDKHNSIALWCKEIMYLNEVDRSLRYDEKQRTWREDCKGKLHEME